LILALFLVLTDAVHELSRLSRVNYCGAEARMIASLMLLLLPAHPIDRALMQTPPRT
jgi:hypothetical protein